MGLKVSGLYKGSFSTLTVRKAKVTELVLRVDIDGARPMSVISGDIFSFSDRVRKYLCSFRFEEVTKTKTDESEILITGKGGQFDSDTEHFPNIQITIALNSRPLIAKVQWVNDSGTLLKCVCKFVSKYFRRVHLQHDYEEEVIPFDSYETNELFCPPPKRTHPISIASAFAEAGIRMIVAKKKYGPISHPKEIPRAGSVWTQDELRKAILEQSIKWDSRSNWTMWLLSAYEYVMSNFKGITIVDKDKKRRGCAVFQSATGWQSAVEKRIRLFIYIHELGHCFNLQHPWNRFHKSNASKMDGYATLSWMNYPWSYYLSEESHGEEAFWIAFNFQFSDSELIHLRHGFRNNVIFNPNTVS